MQIQFIIITQNPSAKYNSIRIQAENITRMEIIIIISIKSFIFSLVLEINFIFIIEVNIIILAYFISY